MGCDSPITPTPPGRLEILSTNTVSPQQTTEVRAFLVGADGTRDDVTTRAKWTTSDSAVLSVSTGGRVTGGALGEATLRATLLTLSASTTVIVVLPGTFRLAGIVRAAGSTTIAGARVQLLAESGEVLTTVTAGAAGFRFYGVAGRARLRVSSPGFHPYEAEIDIHDHATHDVSLSAIDLSGTYTLTLSASGRCRLELPEDVRIRTYTATIDQIDASLTVTLEGPAIYAGWNDRFRGWFGATNDVTFELSLFEVIEVVPTGRMTVSISAAGLSGVLDGDMPGEITNEGGRGSRRVTCTAADHGVTFSRQEP
jgi:hypothetical protein